MDKTVSIYHRLTFKLSEINGKAGTEQKSIPVRRRRRVQSFPVRSSTALGDGAAFDRIEVRFVLAIQLPAFPSLAPVNSGRFSKEGYATNWWSGLVLWLIESRTHRCNVMCLCR
jgi:hypothetical protein